jgi:hypothetical protein
MWKHTVISFSILIYLNIYAYTGSVGLFGRKANPYVKATYGDAEKLSPTYVCDNNAPLNDKALAFKVQMFYIDVYIYIYMCIYSFIYLCMWIWMYVCLCIYYRHICLFTCIYFYIPLYIYLYIFIYLYRSQMWTHSFSKFLTETPRIAQIIVVG